MARAFEKCLMFIQTGEYRFVYSLELFFVDIPGNDHLTPHKMGYKGTGSTGNVTNHVTDQVKTHKCMRGYNNSVIDVFITKN